MTQLTNASSVMYDISGLNVKEFQGHHIFIVKQMFDVSECEQIINFMKQQKTINKLDFHDHNHVRCFSYNTHDIDISVDQTIKEKLQSIPLKMNSKFNNSIDGFSEYELRCVYDYTREHIDGPFGESYLDLNEKEIISTRILTGVLTLNDDFEGGIYSFPKQNIQFKPSRGDLVLFPPYWTHPHSVSGTTNNERYILSTWYVGKPKDTSENPKMNFILFLDNQFR